MARTKADPTLAAIPADALEALVVRCADRLEPQDHQLLAGLVAAFLHLTRLVREGRATLRRLRRLFGLRTSEKRRDVFPLPGSDHESGASTPPAGPGTPVPALPGANTDPPSPPDGASGAAAQAPGADSTGRRKGHGRRPASSYVDAEHIAVGHQSLGPGEPCPLCEGSLYALKDPAQFLRIFGQSLFLARSWDCQRLRCADCQRVFTAKPPTEACGPKFSESAAALIAVLRFWLGTPHYRLGRLQEALGTPIPDATQWDVLHERALEIYPVFQALLHRAAQAPLMHNDDTHMPVLQFMGKRREKLVAEGKLPREDRTGLFTTGIVASLPEGPAALFFTGRRHAGENLAALLERREKELGPVLLMCDALDRNLPKGHRVEEANCLTHGRRGVVDQAESFPAECQHVIDQIGRVYAVDDFCRDEELAPEERLWLHRLESAPVLSQLRTFMTAQIEDKRVEPNSELGQAFNYMLKRWDKFTVFLRVPGAPVDNTICERILKLAVLHRKNSLFYRSERGAVVGDMFMTLIHTAVLHGQNPLAYLTGLMSHPRAVAAAPADWMPWNYREALAAPVVAPPAPSAPSDAAATGTPAPQHQTVPPTTAIPNVPAATTTPATASPDVINNAQEPAAAPRTAPPPSQTANKTHAEPSSRSSRRQKPPLLPPPAFSLFTAPPRAPP
jgi:transposase